MNCMHAAGPQANAVCSVWDRSKTFKGVCVSKPPCVAACAGEGYPNGFCFLDVAAPDHHWSEGYPNGFCFLRRRGVPERLLLSCAAA